MRECPKCGYPVDDNAKNCPVCGALAPKPKGGNAPLVAAVTAVAVALVLLAVLFLPGLLRSPAEEFVSFQREALTASVLSVLERGLDRWGSTQEVSTDMTVTISTDSAEMNQVFADTSLVLKLDMDREKLVFNGDVTIMGTPLLSGALTYEEGRCGFCLPDLDENYYVVDLSRLLSRLTGEEVELGNAKLPEISGREWTALIEAYLDLVSTAVSKDNVTLDKRVDFTLEETGGSCKGNVYTFTPTAADVETVLGKLAGRLENDQDLRSLILKLGSGVSLQVLGEEYAGQDLEAALDAALTDAVACLRENAAQAGKSVEESGFTWKLYMEGKNLRMIRWETGKSAIVWESAESGADGAQALYSDMSGAREAIYRNEYKKTGDEVSGTLAFGTDDSRCTVNYHNKGANQSGTVDLDSGDERITVKYDFNTDTRSVLGIPYGSYTLTAVNEGMQAVIEVAEGVSGGTDFTLTAQAGPDVWGSGISEMTYHISATAGSTAAVPAQPPADITNWSEEELSALVERFSTQLGMRLYSMIVSPMYGA